MQTAGTGPDSPATAIFATLPATASGHPGNLGLNLTGHGRDIMRLGLLSLVIALGLFGADASAATLDRIKKSGVVKIAYRVDAAPYSYKDAIGEPSGYTVDLCRAPRTARHAGSPER